MNPTRLMMRITLAAFFGAITLDVVTKWSVLNAVMVPPRVIEITPFFNLTLAFNTGVSFGLFQSWFAQIPLLLIAAQMIIIAGFLIWAARSKRPFDRLCLALIAGGATANVIDRALDGAVTDFLDFHLRGWHWPAFNVADITIAMGVLGLLVRTLLPANSSGAGRHQRLSERDRT